MILSSFGNSHGNLWRRLVLPKNIETWPLWRTLYSEALLEQDPQELPKKIARAEAAIYVRIKHLEARPKDQIERQALDDALSSLRVMKKLHFPGWNR
jgi:hypothetical protein